VPPIRFRIGSGREELEAGFARIREELDVPEAFPPEVDREARAAASAEATAARVDRRDIALVSIDPEGSRDLDQAFGAERDGTGYTVRYAIADLAVFVRPGGAVDAEAWERVVTRYCPDMRAPLHPEVVSEGAASLLPEVDRPALLWTIRLDRDGAIGEAALERALVRNRRALSYREAQDAIDAGDPPAPLALLPEIGELRLQQERERGGVSIQLPVQEVVPDATGYRLVYDAPLPVEGWNAQISLLTGMSAAAIMLEAGVGVVRTLPEADAETLATLRRRAAALGIDWPRDRGYADFVRGLDPTVAREAAMLTQSARGLRGAGYETFDGAAPTHAEHAGVAAPYAHVTAPLRRLVDRFANEILLAVGRGARPPEWVVAGLEDLPSAMGSGIQRERALERAIVDFVEAMTLRPRVGEVFDAVVTEAGEDGRVGVQIAEPAVVASLRPDRPVELGDRIAVRLVEVVPEQRRIALALAERSGPAA
jgi:exoribonuclease R